MASTKVSTEFKVDIPEEYRSLVSAGEEVAVSSDAAGRLIITPIERVRAQLMESFGMWVDRTDVPSDGVDYVQQIRAGDRIDEVQRGHQAD